MASDNPFAPPETESAVAPQGLGDRGVAWFPVGQTKLVLMIIATAGIYVLYWFYKQYRAQKDLLGEDTWPLARAFFSVFFGFELFGRVATEADAENVERGWDARWLAYAYFIGGSVGASARVFGNLTGSNGVSFTVSLLGLVPLVASTYVLSRVQPTINALLARGRPGLDLNTGFTALNYLVLALGAVFQLMVLIGLVALAAKL